MSFKVGDKVVFKKEKEKGEIIMLIGNLKALVRNSYGFKVQVMISDLILYNSQNASSLSYGESFPDKDVDNDDGGGERKMHFCDAAATSIVDSIPLWSEKREVNLH